MKYKITPGRVIFLIIDVIILLLVAFVCVAPIIHIIMGSISSPEKLNVYTKLIFRPLGKVDLTPYRIILKYKKLWMAYRNTLIYIVSTCALTAVLTSIAGYVFSRKRMFMRNFFMLLISFTMLFNGGMIPTYIIIRKIGLVDTPYSMIIPGALSVFNIILMRTSMQNVPQELEEAARIDGATDIKVLFHVILPLCKATFAVIMLFTAVAKWNDYFSALLYLPNKQQYYPLQMVLREILITTTSDITNTQSLQNSATMYKKAIEYACIVVSTLPILCIYPFVQKYFVTGMTLGAVKS
ncbi:MAG: carbohydrate ABC transporter permease [Lachnospiraceae bacterium]|nr:carbohydrate ABC transporter permease [Lachnospiraceae bacterium]